MCRNPSLNYTPKVGQKTFGVLFFMKKRQVKRKEKPTSGNSKVGSRNFCLDLGNDSENFGNVVNGLLFLCIDNLCIDLGGL